MEEPEEDVELEPSLGSLSRKEARQAAAAHKREVKEARKNEKALKKVAKQEAKEADIQEMSAFDEEVREPAGTPCLVPRICLERGTRGRGRRRGRGCVVGSGLGANDIGSCSERPFPAALVSPGGPVAALHNRLH